MFSRHVFIDSSEFVASSFHFSSSRLKTLLEKSHNGSIDVYMTDVVYREIQDRIRLATQDGIGEIERFLKSSKLRTVRHLIKSELEPVGRIETEELSKRACDDFDQYIRAASITVLPTQDVSTGTLLEMYFGRKEPFGQGKKKSEFPDAISMLALQNWCETNGETIYVVSNDDDVVSAAEVFPTCFPVNGLAEFLEIVTEHEHSELEGFIGDLRSTFEPELKAEIKKIFEEHELYEIDHELNADFLNLTAVSVDLNWLFVIDATPRRISIEVEAEIEFTADVEHYDYDSAAYDKEDDKYLYFDTTKYNFTGTSTQNGTLEFNVESFPPKDWSDLTLDSGYLRPDVIEIDVMNVDEGDRRY